jgi:hypothetical protein
VDCLTSEIAQLAGQFPAPKDALGLVDAALRLDPSIRVDTSPTGAHPRESSRCGKVRLGE